MSAADDCDAKTAQYLADPRELQLIITSALYGRGRQLRARSRTRAYSGPGNAEGRVILRAEAKALDELASALWTNAGTGLVGHLADVVKARAL